jgi:parallel beta-helix repeat protein
MLEEVTDKDALLNIEQFYIDNGKNGLFNIRKIAESNLGLRHTSKTKFKMSKKRKDWIEKNPKFINDLINNMKGNTNGFKKNESSMFKGKKHSDETKEKLRNNRITKNILQYNKEGIFIKKWSDMNEIIAAGFHSSCVLRVCVGDRKSHAGYIWKLEK